MKLGFSIGLAATIMLVASATHVQAGPGRSFSAGLLRPGLSVRASRSAIPEPAIGALLGLSVLGLILRRRRNY